VSLPIPRPGLVICYSYLWATEHRRGTEEGNKNRPCAIVAAHQVIEGREVVTVVPITHTRPAETADAVEIPAALKRHLGLDDLPSWIVVTETNDFIWPGRTFTPCRARNLPASTTACCRRASSLTFAIAFYTLASIAVSTGFRVRNSRR
jgi:hypothetical protein